MNSRPSVSSGRRGRASRNAVERALGMVGRCSAISVAPTVIGQGRHRSPPRTACRRRTSGATPRSRPPRCRPGRTRTRSQPDSNPWHSAPPNASPAPRPHTTSTGYGATRSRVPSAVGHEHTVAAHLDDRRLEAAGEQRVGGPIGIRLADRDLALGAVADRHRDLVEHEVELRRRVGRVASRTAAASRGRARCACGRARHVSRSWIVVRLGSSRQARRREPQHRHGRDDVAVDVGARDVHVGRLRLAVEDDASARPGAPARRTRAASAASGSVPTKRVSTPNVSLERAAHVLAERIVADAREHRRAMAESGARRRRRWWPCHRSTCGTSAPR